MKTHYKTELLLEDMSQMALIVAILETIGKLGWKLIYLSQYGIVAHTANTGDGKVQEIIVRREKDSLLLRSDDTAIDLFSKKKHLRNVTNFLSTFNTVRKYVSDEYAFALLQTHPLHFAHPQHDILSPGKFEKIGKRTSLLNFFKPVEGYYVTPLLLLSNILVFAVMIFMGADLFEPASRVIYDWGANYGPAVLGGDWWRLLSAMFLHIGIVHLLSNMMALGFIGFAIEPVLGRKRFLTAYIISGIAGSIFSVCYHPEVISAGASGAIFGMYGVLIALLSTGLGKDRVSDVALPIMSLYILYQLALGMKAGVDNAAHIGGLIGGLLTGYAMYPGLRNTRQNVPEPETDQV